MKGNGGDYSLTSPEEVSHHALVECMSKLSAQNEVILIELERAATVAKEARKDAAKASDAIFVEILPKLSHLSKVVGEPGDPSAVARASAHDLTIAELERKEYGTGLCGAVTQLASHDARQDRKMSALAEAGHGAARGAGWVSGATAVASLVWGIVEIVKAFM